MVNISTFANSGPILKPVRHIRRVNKYYEGALTLMYFHKTYVVTSPYNRLTEPVLRRGKNICFKREIRIKISQNNPQNCSLSGAL